MTSSIWRRLSVLAALVLVPVVAYTAQNSLFLPTTGTYSGLQAANTINAAFSSLTSCNSGTSAPANDVSGVPLKGQCWLDTSVTPNLVKIYDGTSWVVVGAIDTSNHLWTPPVGGGAAATLASATTTDLGSVPQAFKTITGTTAITSFGSSAITGTRHTVLFQGALTLTYNGTSMILPGGGNITTAAGDIAEAIYLGASNWHVVGYQRADGTSVANPAVPVGSYVMDGGADVPTGYLQGYGQPIARSSYPAYLARVTRTQSAVRSSGNNTLTSVGDTSKLGAGMPIEGTGIPNGTTISSVTSNTIVMSANASSSGTSNATVFLSGYGSGGDSTTVGVWDCRGYVLAGRDDMGGTAASRLTSSYFGTSAAKIGAVGGSESHAQQLSEVASHQHGVFLKDPGHQHTAQSGPSGSGSVFFLVGQTASVGATGINSAVTGITIGSVSGVANDNQTATAGSSAAAPIVQPTRIAECLVRVQP